MKRWKNARLLAVLAAAVLAAGLGGCGKQEADLLSLVEITYSGLDGEGQAVFRAGDPITGAEAAVLLDRALQVTDVDAQVFAPAAPAWAAQSAANLSTCGMLDAGGDLSAALTRGEAAQLICSALELLDSRDTGWF